MRCPPGGQIYRCHEADASNYLKKYYLIFVRPSAGFYLCTDIFNKASIKNSFITMGQFSLFYKFLKHGRENVLFVLTFEAFLSCINFIIHLPFSPHKNEIHTVCMCIQLS